MKYIFFSILFFAHIVCSAQITSLQKDSDKAAEERKWNRIFNDGLEVNSKEDAQNIFAYALKLEKADSVIKAYKAYKLIYYFDSTSSLASASARRLDVITAAYVAKQQSSVLGTWKWKWSGSNWGTGDTPDQCKCEKSMVIDKEKIYFFENNRLTGSYNYTFKPYGSPRWNMITLIDIPGIKETWDFGFPARLLWPALDIEAPLSINRQYNCVCGCPDEIYERVTQP